MSHFIPLSSLSNDSLSSTTTVLGGGLIGLSVAWTLAAQHNRKVILIERDTVGSAASFTAAGMLAPLAEIDYVEEELIELKRTSLARFPAFVERLERASNLRVHYRTEGTLLTAIDRDDAEDLHRHFEYQQSLDLPVSWLSSSQARSLEPLLTPNVQAAVHIPSDHQVDNRLLLRALRTACLRAGVLILEHTTAHTILHDGSQLRGVTLHATQDEDSDTPPETFDLLCPQIVYALGAWSRRIHGLPRPLLPPTRPVKGQLLVLGPSKEHPNILQHVIRTSECYLVPRTDGRLLVGATSEEMGFDTDVTAGGVFSLLRAAYETLPITYELPLLSTHASLRPGSIDNDPILGHTPIQGLIMATGHFRNGVLLTPITAETIAHAVVHGTDPDLIHPFGLSRFLHS